MTHSLALRRALTGEHSDEVAITLVTITHASLPDVTVRLCDAYTRLLSEEPEIYCTTSRGEDFLYSLIRGSWPDNKQGEPRRCAIEFDNITANHVALIRQMRGPASLKFEFVRACEPDYVEDTFDLLHSISAEYDPNTIKLDLSRENFLAEPLPCWRMSRNFFPGLFF